MRAKVAVATLYQLGQGREEDLVAAKRWFEEAAEAGDLQALYQGGIMCLGGKGLPRNLGRAESYLRQSAKGGYMKAVLALAEFYSRGDGSEPNLREAETWYRLAADNGDVQAMFIAGRLAATGDGSVQSLPEAAKYFLRAAEQGHPIAAQNIASFYATGQECARQRRRSAGSRPPPRRACRRSSAPRANADRGRKPAERPFRRAVLARTGDLARRRRSEGAARLVVPFGGIRFERTEKAVGLLQEAATSGFSAAALQLGHIYAGRYNLTPSPADALRWYTIAAEAGQTEAQFLLGSILRHGALGRPADPRRCGSMVPQGRRSRARGRAVRTGGNVLHRRGR